MIYSYDQYLCNISTKTLSVRQVISVMSVTCISHHARSLDGLGDDPSVRFTPEHVTFKLLRAAVHDHCEGVAVVTDAQEGEEAYLTLPEWLVAVLSARQEEG